MTSVVGQKRREVVARREDTRCGGTYGEISRALFKLFAISSLNAHVSLPWTYDG